MIGRVVPELQSYIDGTTLPHREWVANLAVTGSAERVYRELRAQAQGVGFRDVDSVAQACNPSSDPGEFGLDSESDGFLVTCSGGGHQPDPGRTDRSRSVAIEVARCASCRPTTGIGRVHYDAGAGTGFDRNVEPLAVSPRNGGSNPSVWADLPGTSVLRSGWYYACQQNQFVALSVSGDPNEVWERAIDNSLSVVGAVSQVSKRGRVREALTADGSDVVLLTLDERTKPRPILYVNLCEG